MDASAAIDEADPPPKRPPAYCPWCGQAVVKRWIPDRISSLRHNLNVRSMFVCLTCKIGVRAFTFPSRALFATKKAARAYAQQAYEDLEASGFNYASTRKRYESGKCACSPYQGMPLEPCPVHRPLESKAP